MEKIVERGKRGKIPSKFRRRAKKYSCQLKIFLSPIIFLMTHPLAVHSSLLRAVAKNLRIQKIIFQNYPS
jgi:hypothetical protein